MDSQDLLPMPELPVVRDTYCSQEMTDKLIQNLRDNRQDLIAELVRQEKRGVPEGRDDLHGKRYGDVIEYFREKVGPDIEVPPSRLGMLDLLYELSRRIRHGLGLQEVPVFGVPFAAGPEGPFPPLTQVPLRIVKNKEHQLSQELVDRIVQSAYEKSPAVFYEFSEQIRRLMRSYEISQAFYNLIENSLPEEQKDPWSIVMGSAHRWLREMCALPSYEALKRMFGSS